MLFEYDRRLTWNNQDIVEEEAACAEISGEVVSSIILDYISVHEVKLGVGSSSENGSLCLVPQIMTGFLYCSEISPLLSVCESTVSYYHNSHSTAINSAGTLNHHTEIETEVQILSALDVLSEIKLQTGIAICFCLAELEVLILRIDNLIVRIEVNIALLCKCSSKFLSIERSSSIGIRSIAVGTVRTYSVTNLLARVEIGILCIERCQPAEVILEDGRNTRMNALLNGKNGLESELLIAEGHVTGAGLSLTCVLEDVEGNLILLNQSLGLRSEGNPIHIGRNRVVNSGLNLNLHCLSLIVD